MIFKNEKEKGEDDVDVTKLRRQHIIELKKKKKLQAKDDFGRVDVRRSMEDQYKHRDNLIADSYSDLLRDKIGNDSH